ncbi:hypothetical protein GCM10010277_81890 [Streptomyces longisporoflavus]|nr:hypothetical protein GCM10010277_81890 [Streptomyces longisporoflavus]
MSHQRWQLTPRQWPGKRRGLPRTGGSYTKPIRKTSTLHDEREESWRNRVEVVAMDGFTGFKTAAGEELPDAVALMDPFHVVRLAGDALDRCRRRVQLAIHGHLGRRCDPLYAARRTLHTGAGLLNDRQKDRLAALFASDAHVEVEATWGVYQRMIAAYREPDRSKGRELMVKLIESVSQGVTSSSSEIITLGRTLKKRATDVLAYFERPGTSDGPTEGFPQPADFTRAFRSAMGVPPTHYRARYAAHPPPGKGTTARRQWDDPRTRTTCEASPRPRSPWCTTSP